MKHIFIINSSINGHLGCSHLLSVMKNAAMNMGLRASDWVDPFKDFGYKCRDGGWNVL
jgi:hypothetical protein